MPPNLGAALALGFRALARAPWLVAASVGVSALRRLATAPAWAVAVAVIVRGAVSAASRHPLDPLGALGGALAAASSPRLVVVVAGLGVVGAVLGAVLRVAWLSGALPELAGAVSAGPPAPRFAAGAAYGFPRVLAAALLGLALDLAATGFGAALALAALSVTARVAGTGAPVLLAGAVAGALTLAVAVPLALSTVADAAVARAAIRAEGPGDAFAAGGARFLARPGTFVLAALAFAAAAAIAPGAIEAFGGTLTGFARGAPPLALAGPQLMLGVAALVVAAVVDLWWLGTVAALACAEAPGRPLVGGGRT